MMVPVHVPLCMLSELCALSTRISVILYPPQNIAEGNLAHSFMSFNTCYTDTGLWCVGVFAILNSDHHKGASHCAIISNSSNF